MIGAATDISVMQEDPRAVGATAMKKQRGVPAVG